MFIFLVILEMKCVVKGGRICGGKGGSFESSGRFSLRLVGFVLLGSFEYIFF